MGLDMYLHAERSLSPYTTDEDALKIFNKVKDEVIGNVPMSESFSFINVDVCIGYWRKSNHIHKWFVDNVQAGEDNCQKYYLYRETLVELRRLCDQILREPDPTRQSLALELLPPDEGFFFGEAEIGDWYWEDLRYTVAMLDRILECKDFIAEPGLGSWCFYYQSSW